MSFVTREILVSVSTGTQEDGVGRRRCFAYKEMCHRKTLTLTRTQPLTPTKRRCQQRKQASELRRHAPEQRIGRRCMSRAISGPFKSRPGSTDLRRASELASLNTKSGLSLVPFSGGLSSRPTHLVAPPSRRSTLSRHSTRCSTA